MNNTQRNRTAMVIVATPLSSHTTTTGAVPVACSDGDVLRTALSITARKGISRNMAGVSGA